MVISVDKPIGFFEDFEIDLPPPKLTPSFYQTKLFGQVAACLALVGAAFSSILCGVSIYQEWNYWYLQLPIYLNLAAYFLILSYHLATKTYYTDPVARKAIRQKLEQNQISIHDFIETHGWDNIRRFGLHIASNSEPMVSKEKMREIALVLLDKNPLPFFYRIELNKTYLPIMPGSFWDMLEHKLFTDKEIDGFAKLLVSNLKNISIITLLENYPFIQKFALDRYFQPSQIQWLEKNLEEYKKSRDGYLNLVSFLTTSYGKLKTSSLFLLTVRILAEVGGYAAIIAILLLISYGVYLMTNFVGKFLAIKTLKILDPTFSLKPKNIHLDLIQHLTNAQQRMYIEARERSIKSFENQWVNKQLEFRSLSQ